jgi:hypothetical protein
VSERQHLDQAKQYQVRVKGRIDDRWSDWFDEFAVIAQPDGETLLTGQVEDQAALHGLLAKIRDLGLPLISINEIDDQNQEE